MIRHFSSIVFLLGALVIGYTSVAAQQPTKPEHRFAIRLNTLSWLNLSGVGEVEYLLSQRVGVFAGGGAGIETVNPFGVPIYAHFENTYCKVSGWSTYAGIRLGLPIWNFTGLSFKAIAVVGHSKFAGFGCFPSIDTPPIPDPSIVNWVSGYLCLSYAQPFARRFFIEPVVGAGPMYGWQPLESHQGSWVLRGALQLNVGVRF